MPKLELNLSIAGNPDFSQLVPYGAVEDGREWPHDSMWIYQDGWDVEGRFFVNSGDVNLELEAEDLGKRHDIIVRADPNDLTEAFDPAHNETSVRVDIPATPPSEERNLPCTSPVP